MSKAETKAVRAAAEIYVLDVVTPIQISDTLLIPIRADITKLFGTTKIQFQLSFKNKKIVLESPEISQDLEIQDRHLEPEAMIV